LFRVRADNVEVLGASVIGSFGGALVADVVLSVAVDYFIFVVLVGPYVVDVNVVLFKNDVDNGAYNVDFFYCF
jgi:hypothetical protein